MPLEASLDLRGADDLLRKLDALGKRIEKRSLGRALSAGARPIQKAAQAMAPKDTGSLRKSIRVKRVSKPQRGGTAYTVYAVPKYLQARTQKKASYSGYYAAYQELGTRFQSPHPFLVPAFAEMSDVAQKIIAARLVYEIDQVIKQRGLGDNS